MEILSLQKYIQFQIENLAGKNNYKYIGSSFMIRNIRSFQDGTILNKSKDIKTTN